uniref:Carbam_trans_C domain-containing protein n=1 Tax=Angiostrongylus cantonensis TaxID=6313 RepID=A0A0K0DME6_ANGCA
MEAAWITKNYGDGLYLQCTYTCSRVLDRVHAHANKKDKGLAETRGHHPFNAVYDTGEEFLGTCDSRGVDVLINTSLFMNIDSNNLQPELDVYD